MEGVQRSASLSLSTGGWATENAGVSLPLPDTTTRDERTVGSNEVKWLQSARLPKRALHPTATVCWPRGSSPRLPSHSPQQNGPCLVSKNEKFSVL